MKRFLAIDIGASSGRHIVGWLEDNQIKTEEVYRFPNGVKTENNHLVWDTEELFKNVKHGIKVALDKYCDIVSLAIDTWGVDYVLLNGDKPILPCYAYRDGRTEQAIAQVHKIIAFEELYSRTGIQFEPFNTIYQLYQDKGEGRLKDATDFLMMPEYLSYMLTGVKKHEYTNATTTGLVNAQTGEYDREIIARLGFPDAMFTKLSATGTAVGKLKDEIAQEVGGQIEVVLCATHDTASAVEGIPMEGNSPYISSGTWSLLGLKVPKAITDENSCKSNYSNEGGVGYIRYQKNIMGMWVVNRLKAEICPEKPFPQIVEEARQSEFTRFVDVNENVFLAPDSMKEAFDCHFSSDDRPQTDGDYFRCAFLSLAHSYNTALTELKSNSGKDFDTLYIVGGGAKNGLLNELTEKICNIKVNALPIEATAIGNLKIQIKRGVESE